MYNIPGYVMMINDRVRMEAYVRALRQAVRPGSVVLDLGAGLGVFALLACRFGARRVFAIEPDNVLHLARALAQANGYADRVEFIQEMSTRVELPERADVIISDLRGVLPLFRSHLPSMVDARRRLLAPGGTLIPQRDTLWAAVVELPERYSRYLPPAGDLGYGLDFGPVRLPLTSTWQKGRARPEQLLVEPRPWATLDYTTLEEPGVQGEVLWEVTRAGTGHGLAVWFDTELVPGVTLSSGPSAPEVIYGGAFFPWSEPVALAAGDRVSVLLQAGMVGDDYQWRWDTRVLEQGSHGPVKTCLRQSTFHGTPLALAQVHKRAAAHVPTLDEQGQIDRFILGLMDGATSLDAIAQELVDRFPDRFADWHQALDRVATLSVLYSR
jgi:protein arginine N-methyltransferase 1